MKLFKNFFKKKKKAEGENQNVAIHWLLVEPDSEAEEFIIKQIQPNCNDKMICRLGVLFGIDYNSYGITHSDYVKNLKLINKLKGED